MRGPKKATSRARFDAVTPICAWACTSSGPSSSMSPSTATALPSLASTSSVSSAAVIDAGLAL